MFSATREQRAGTHFEAQFEYNYPGTVNRFLSVYESCIITIYSTNGALQRYVRHKNVQIPHPPIESDQKFYCSHTSDAVFDVFELVCELYGDKY